MDNKYKNKLTSIIEDCGFNRTRKANQKEIEQALFEATKPGYPPEEAQDPSSKEGISNAIASEFFARCRALATTTHFAHLSTDSFSEHSALATFYEEIVETVDKFCEAYIGLYGKFITLPPISAEMKIAVDAIIELRDWISKNRNLITDDTSMQNIIDESVELCNTTIYKLQKLK
jgi:hypothetical protein